MIAPMVGAHRVRPKFYIDISTKLRCTQFRDVCQTIFENVPLLDRELELILETIKVI